MNHVSSSHVKPLLWNTAAKTAPISLVYRQRELSRRNVRFIPLSYLTFSLAHTFFLSAYVAVRWARHHLCRVYRFLRGLSVMLTFNIFLSFYSRNKKKKRKSMQETRVAPTREACGWSKLNYVTAVNQTQLRSMNNAGSRFDVSICRM